MRRNIKTIIVLVFFSIPVVALFQNCGKIQAVSMTDLAPSSKVDSVVNTNDLPIGDTQIDQIGSGASVSGDSSASSGDVSDCESGEGSEGSEGGEGGESVSIGGPSEKEQEEQEIEDSVVACAALENSSNSNNINGSGVFSEDHKSASHINGKHVLSSSNFNGNTQIASISSSFGSLTICGLDVETISNYSGKITLVNNSRVGTINSLNGRLVIVDGSGAKLRNSKVVIKKVR